MSNSDGLLLQDREYAQAFLLTFCLPGLGGAYQVSEKLLRANDLTLVDAAFAAAVGPFLTGPTKWICSGL